MVTEEPVEVRPAKERDFDAWFALFDAVAMEGKWIGREGPLDREACNEIFRTALESPEWITLLAESHGKVVGEIGIHSRNGLADFGMMVDAGWRGRGVGSALLESCIAWARGAGCHKVTLQVWPHNEAAICLYRKTGFAEEGYFHRQYRRRNGEVWDAISMGLVLDTTSPESSHPHRPFQA